MTCLWSFKYYREQGSARAMNVIAYTADIILIMSQRTACLF